MSEIAFWSILTFSHVPPDERDVESQGLPVLAACLQFRGMGQAPGYLLTKVSREVVSCTVDFSRPELTWTEQTNWHSPSGGQWPHRNVTLCLSQPIMVTVPIQNGTGQVCRWHWGLRATRQSAAAHFLLGQSLAGISPVPVSPCYHLDYKFLLANQIILMYPFLLFPIICYKIPKK